MIVCIFARQSSPSLLTMLKSCEAFFVYTHLNMANLIPFTKRFESSENLVDLLESRGLQICGFTSKNSGEHSHSLLRESI